MLGHRFDGSHKAIVTLDWTVADGIPPRYFHDKHSSAIPRPVASAGKSDPFTIGIAANERVGSRVVKWCEPHLESIPSVVVKGTIGGIANLNTYVFGDYSIVQGRDQS